MNNIAIIPARSGSKGLKDKNILELNGKPLMYYTIKAALESECFSEVMVSTDSEKYAEIARACGANVPFLRSEKMASDNAGSWDTVREVLQNYKKVGKEFDKIALLQPTSPLRDAYDILGAFKKLDDKQANAVISIVEVDHPVQWCFKLDENGSMNELASSSYNYMRRQDLEKHYRENGAIYIVDACRILDTSYNFYADNCFGYIMPSEKSIDIDKRMDFEIAKVYLEKLL